jgi:hypothetical protein
VLALASKVEVNIRREPSKVKGKVGCSGQLSETPGGAATV